MAESGVIHELITPRGTIRFNDFLGSPIVLGVANNVRNPNGLGGQSGWDSLHGAFVHTIEVTDLPGAEAVARHHVFIPSPVDTNPGVFEIAKSPVTPNSRVFSRAWMRPIPAGAGIVTIRIRLAFYTNTDSFIGYLTPAGIDAGGAGTSLYPDTTVFPGPDVFPVGNATLDSNVWIELGGSVIAPSNAAYVQTYLEFLTDSTPTSWQMDFTNVMTVETDEEEPSYRDGSVGAPYAWEDGVGTSRTVEVTYPEQSLVFKLDEVSADVAVRKSVVPRPHHHGVRTKRGRRGGVYPVLKGRFLAPSPADRESMRAALSAAAYSILDDYGIWRWKPSNGNGGWRQMQVQLYEQLNIGQGLIKDFQLPLVAEKPFIFGDELKQQDTSFLSASGGGGFTFPFVFPFTFPGTAGTGSGSFTNEGENETYPILRVYGPVTNPVVRNDTTQSRITFTGLTLNAGEYVDLDTWDESAFRNDGVDLSGKLDLSNTDFFTLVPGANVISLQGTAPDVTSTRVTVFWRDSYS